MKKNKIVAVLGPTNTGKTFYAIETMLSFDSGMIGFPLRLLAREVYDKIIKKIDQGVWEFKGGGFGHGVGMSQAGAIDLALRGWSTTKILQHYYPGTRYESFR